MKNGIFISILALSPAGITPRMKKLASLLLLAFPLALGCGSSGTGAASDVQALQPLEAECNAIGAVAAGAAHQVVVRGDVSQCGEVISAFVEFGVAGCFGLMPNGLFGTASTSPAGPNEGAITNLGQVVCDSVEACGLCLAALMQGVCVPTCTL